MSLGVIGAAPPSGALLGLLGWVRDRTGLEIPQNRMSTCDASIQRAMSNASVSDLYRFRQVLESDPVAFDALVDELTIGETYFFRDPRQFAFLRTVALPEVMRTRAPGHVLSAWSAGCASGEEPYSLAILMQELGLGERRRILGTDLSRRRLATARRGRYGKWSLRGVASTTVDRYFEREGAGFELVPSIRSSVQFRYLNLADDLGRDESARGFDLIVCRNVLIYFDAATIARVHAQLVDRLACGGWLMLGPSDPTLSTVHPCDVVMTEAGLAYRRRVRGASGEAAVPTRYVREDSLRDRPLQSTITAPAPFVPAVRAAPASAGAPDSAPAPGVRISQPTAIDVPSVPSVPSVARLPLACSVVGQESLGKARKSYGERDYEQAAAHAKQFLHEGGRDSEGWALLARSLANAGRTGAAALACAAGLEAHGTSAELTVLHSLLLTELNRHDAAAVAARRALYLDRELVVAHVALGNALVRAGQVRSARRTFANALRLLAALPPTSAVPASDGTPAAHLAAVVGAQVRRLLECAP